MNNSGMGALWFPLRVLQWTRPLAGRLDRVRLVRPRNRFGLAANAACSFHGRASVTRILCASGSVWVTQAGDPRDHVLQRGQTFTCGRDGLVAVAGLEDSVVSVTAGEHR